MEKRERFEQQDGRQQIGGRPGARHAMRLLAIALGGYLLLGAGPADAVPSETSHFVYYVTGDGTELRRVLSDGTGDTLILGASPHGRLLNVIISGSGTAMAFACGSNGWDFQVWVAGTDGSSVQKVADTPWSLAVGWLAEDSEVLFNRYDGVYRASLSGGADSQWISIQPFLAFGRNSLRDRIQWSADHTRFVALVGQAYGGGNTIFVGEIEFASGALANVRQVSPPGSFDWYYGNAQSATISADGSTVFYGWRDLSLARFEIRRTDFEDTSEQVIWQRTNVVEGGPGPLRLSPDGTRLWLGPYAPAGLGQPASSVIASMKLDGSDYRELLTSTWPWGLSFDIAPGPPQADAGQDQTVGEGAQVSLDGSNSTGGDLTYSWEQLAGPTVSLSDLTSPSPSFIAPTVGPGGSVLVFQLVVTDGVATSAPDEVVVTVRNINDPPACNLARPGQERLWPPNHSLLPVEIVGVTDPQNDQVAFRVTGVTQDEPVSGLGDADTSPDAVLQGELVLLRAERSGAGNGRVYRVQFTADDGQGGVCSGAVWIGVPHSNRPGQAIVDDGQTSDSTQP